MKIQLNIRLLPLLKPRKYRKRDFYAFFCSILLLILSLVQFCACSYDRLWSLLFHSHWLCVPSFFPLIHTFLTIRYWTSMFVLWTSPVPNTHTHALPLCGIFDLGSWKASQKEGAEGRLQQEGESGGDGRKYFFPLLSDKNPTLHSMVTQNYNPRSQSFTREGYTGEEW